MVNGTAKLVIDLGNSSTRVIVKFGNNSKGTPRVRLAELSNRFGVIDNGRLAPYMDSPVYNEDNSRIFTYHGENYCNGELCDTEFGSVAMRPSALEKKYNSQVTRLSIQNALCIGYETIADFTNSDISSVDVDWDMTILLPPDDVEVGSKEISVLARSITAVKFLMPEFEKEIKINKIKIYPEGFAAFIAVLFESFGKIRSEYSYLTAKSSTTLIVDIGAGTTDFMLVKGTNAITSSRFTREVGGNNVHQRVRRLMKQKGIPLSDTAAREGCEVGYVMSGARKQPIIEEIAQAKSDVSKQLVDAVQEFFEDNMIPIQSVTNLLICGGGAEESDVEGIEPIGKYIFEFMKGLSRDVNMVELPKVGESCLVDFLAQGQDDADLEAIKSRKMSSRMLNIIGAGILSE